MISVLSFPSFQSLCAIRRAVGLVIASLWFTAAVAADVSFKQAFDAASGQDVVVVTVPDTDVLVFDTGAFYTQGKRLVVVASRARLTGETRIGFYPPDQRPALKPGVAGTGATGPAGASYNCGRSGCAGSIGAIGGTGATGDTGAVASTMLLDIKELQGDGKLLLVSAGQAGGEGQKGGKGGTGGRGGDGAKRSCGGLAGLDTKAGPGDGGTGGPGGPGGTGGAGGPGGAGGTLVLAPELSAAIQGSRVVVDLTGAQGGPGGRGGDAGDPGAGGGMGGGNSCGGGGRSGGGGGPGTGGASGQVGGWGSQGALNYLADANSVASSKPKSLSRKLTHSAGQTQNCSPDAVVQVETTIPSGMTLVAIEPVKISRLQGAVGFARPLTARTSTNPNMIQIEGVVSRAFSIVPISYQPFPPNIKFRKVCPPLEMEIEIHYAASPAESELGKKIAAPK